MNRRAFLSAAGGAALAAFAGCTGGSAGSAAPAADATTTGTSTTGDGTSAVDGEPSTTGGGTATAGGFPTSVVGVDPAPVPEGASVDATATLTRQFSAGSPAELEVALTNVAESERTFSFGAVPPWSAVWGARQSEGGEPSAGNATLLMVPGPVEETAGGDVVPAKPTDGCWKATDGLALLQVIRERTLAPGETLSGRYTLVGAHGNDGCLSDGTYRFEDENYVGAGWGFAVRIG